MEVYRCEYCKKLEKIESRIKDSFFSYRKIFSHWIWHEKGHFLFDPFSRLEGNPFDYATITMSKWNYIDDERVVVLTWKEEIKWNLSLFISGEKKKEEIVIIPEDITNTMDVNIFMNLCCCWMRESQKE